MELFALLIFGSIGLGALISATSNDNAAPEEDVVPPEDDQIDGTDGADEIIGGLGDSTLNGFGSADQIFGNAGDDTIRGGDGDDLIYGGDGDDELFGDNGNDTLYGEAGNDRLIGTSFRFGDENTTTLYGGAGDDSLSRANIMYGGDGNDSLYAGQIMDGGAGDDHLFGDIWHLRSEDAASGAVMTGGTGADVFHVTSYTATHDAEDRYDSYPEIITDFNQAEDELHVADVYYSVPFGTTYSTVIDVVDHADGAAVVTVTTFEDGSTDTRTSAILQGVDAASFDMSLINGDATINGTEGDDSITGSFRNELIYGLGGDDTINGLQGDDVIYGGAGDDTLEGFSGADTLYGGDGNDVLSASRNSQLFGEAGDDVIYASGAYNTLDGGVGNDRLTAHGFGNEVHGGDGDDIVSSGAGGTSYGDAGNDTLSSAVGNYSSGPVSVASTLYGGTGDDLLTGSGLLDGGAGNDTLRAHYNPGADTILTGGAGVDSFSVGHDPAAALYADWREYDYGYTLEYDTVTITDFDPATEVLQVEVMLSTLTEASFVTEDHGDDTWVVVTDYEGIDSVVAILQGVSSASIQDGSITLHDRAA